MEKVFSGSGVEVTYSHDGDNFEVWERFEHGWDCVSTFDDSASAIQFAEVEIESREFAEMLT